MDQLSHMYWLSRYIFGSLCFVSVRAGTEYTLTAIIIYEHTWALVIADPTSEQEREGASLEEFWAAKKRICPDFPHTTLFWEGYLRQKPQIRGKLICELLKCDTVMHHRHLRERKIQQPNYLDQSGGLNPVVWNVLRLVAAANYSQHKQNINNLGAIFRFYICMRKFDLIPKLHSSKFRRHTGLRT